MNDTAMETRLANLEAEVQLLRRDLAASNKRVQTFEDIEAIKKLQAAYGYYVEHMMTEEIIACFSTHPDAFANFAEGTYLGPEGIRRHFEQSRNMPNSFLHMVMQTTPYITVAPDGTRAKGRWYGYGDIMLVPTEPLDPGHIAMIYEMEYIKENGVWKIFSMRQNMIFLYRTGLGKPLDGGRKPSGPPHKQQPDIVAEYDTEYPSGYIFPMHFVHPVTGEPSTEEAHNKTLQLGPSKRRPA